MSEYTDGPLQTTEQEGSVQASQQKGQPHVNVAGPLSKPKEAEGSGKEQPVKVEQDNSHHQQEQPQLANQSQQTETNSFQLAEKETGYFGQQSFAAPKVEVSQPSVVDQQNVKQTVTQQAPAAAGGQDTKKGPSIPFNMLIPILQAHLDRDKDMQLQTVWAKLRKWMTLVNPHIAALLKLMVKKMQWMILISEIFELSSIYLSSIYLAASNEASFKERLNEMEETNKALRLQVKVLEEKSNSTAEENLSLVKSLNELDTRVQALEAKAAPGEVSMAQMVPEYKMMDQKDLAGPLLHQQTRGFTEGNNMIAEQGLDGSVAIISDNNYSQVNNSPSNAYAGNRLEENSLQHMEKASIKSSTAEGIVDQNEHQFDRSIMSEEIMPVPLDDIQIHEDDAQQSEGGDEAAEVPFSDAPIIGAPFRMISFVARYVSGADLVGEK